MKIATKVILIEIKNLREKITINKIATPNDAGFKCRGNIKNVNLKRVKKEIEKFSIKVSSF